MSEGKRPVTDDTPMEEATVIPAPLKHIRAAGPAENYICSACNTHFLKYQSLITHINKEHAENSKRLTIQVHKDLTYVCSGLRCKHRATTTDELEEHIKANHNDKARIPIPKLRKLRLCICPAKFCTVSFVQREELKDHIKLDHPEQADDLIADTYET